MSFIAVISLLSILTGVIVCLYSRYTKSYHYITKQSPLHHHKELIILWDIHGVLFEKRMLHWLYVVATYPHIFSLLKKLDKKTIKILAKHCGKKMGIIKEEVTNQELVNCAKKVDNQALIDLTIRISCAYKPKHKTIDIVKRLHATGYTQHIGSNIGKAIFELFAPQHSAVFTYFSYFHIIDTKESSTKIKKPNKEFFLSYIAIHQKHPHDILFIDDRWANIKAARSCGLQAIYFKNSLQLEKELERLGLFEKKNTLI